MMGFVPNTARPVMHLSHIQSLWMEWGRGNRQGKAENVIAPAVVRGLEGGPQSPRGDTLPAVPPHKGPHDRSSGDGRIACRAN